MSWSSVLKLDNNTDWNTGMLTRGTPVQSYMNPAGTPGNYYLDCKFWRGEDYSRYWAITSGTMRTTKRRILTKHKIKSTPSIQTTSLSTIGFKNQASAFGDNKLVHWNYYVNAGDRRQIAQSRDAVGGSVNSPFVYGWLLDTFYWQEVIYDGNNITHNTYADDAGGAVPGTPISSNTFSNLSINDVPYDSVSVMNHHTSTGQVCYGEIHHLEVFDWVTPPSIYVGNDATGGTSTSLGGLTVVDVDNPAEIDGTIVKVRIDALTFIDDVYIQVWSKVGDDLTLEAEQKISFRPGTIWYDVSLPILTGQHIGRYTDSSGIIATGGASDRQWTTSGKVSSFTDSTPANNSPHVYGEISSTILPVKKSGKLFYRGMVP